MTAALAVVFGSSVVIQISRYVDLKWVFIVMGSFSIMVGFFMIFGIKDVIKIKKQESLLRKSQIASAQSTP